MKRDVIIIEPACPKCGTLRKFIGADEYYCKTCNKKGLAERIEIEYPF